MSNQKWTEHRNWATRNARNPAGDMQNPCFKKVFY